MSNTPNNPPEQNPPPQNPPPQEPLNAIIRLLLEQLQNLLTSTSIGESASRHPLITNLIVLLVLSVTGINIFSLAGINIFSLKNEPKKNEFTESIQKDICTTYQDEAYPNYGSNEISISPELKRPDDNTDNRMPNLNCKYTKNDKTEPKEKEILIKFDHDRVDSPKIYRIDKNRKCENFKAELKDKMNLRDIKFKPPEIVSKPVETNDSIKPLFNCEYTIQKDNEEPKPETFVVMPQLLLADLAKDTKSYDEYSINMEDVCRSDYITKKLTGEIREKDPKQEIKLVPKGAILQKEYRDIYPVFRWECNYEIQRKQKNGRIRRTTEALGISIDEDYCQQNYREQATKATHHDYNDPYSLYCTRPDHR